MRLFRNAGFLFVLLSSGMPAAMALTINTQFAELFQSDSTAIGAGKVGILVVDEGTVPGLADPFGTVLTEGNYLGGNSDDRIIGVTRSVGNVGGTHTSGFQDIFPSLVYNGNFNEGDKLYFLWFPAITSKGATVGADISYGAYRSDVVNDASGSDIAFFAPADGTYDLFAYLDVIAPGSDVTALDFTAKLMTVPEPSVLWLLVAAGAGWLVVRPRSRHLVVVAGGLLAGSSIQAQIWNAGAGFWANAANWEDGLPVSGDNTYIGNGGTATVAGGTTAYSFGSLNIAGQSGSPSTVLVQSNATLDASGGDINLGNSLTSSLDDVVGHGRLTVTGFQAKLINAGILHVGTEGGSGELLIDGGGAITSTSGYLGCATMGSAASGSTATVTGAGSKWTTGGLTVDSGALLVVANGGNVTLASGNVTVHSDASVAGNGTINGAISLEGTISTNGAPDTLTTGAQTWMSGGTYSWFVNNADPLLTPGDAAGWSRLVIEGALIIESTALNPFVIDLHSLTSGNTDGVVSNFTPDADQSWIIATVTAGVNSFSSDKFAIETSAFFNAHSGSFSVAVEGDDLLLKYAAVPELSTSGAGAVMLAAFAVATRRRAPAALPS